MFFDLPGCFQTIKPCNADGPQGWGHEPCQNAHCRGFSCAIWPEKCHDFPLVDGERDVIQRGCVPVAFGHMLNVNHTDAQRVVS